MAKLMVENGINISTIIQATGLTQEQIESLDML